MINNCIICFEEIELKDLTALSCGHMFHIDCIITLVKKRNNAMHSQLVPILYVEQIRK